MISDSYVALEWIEPIYTYTELKEEIDPELFSDREFVLEAVKRNGDVLSLTPIGFRGDYEIVLEAVKHFGIAIVSASNELKGNKTIVLTALKTFISAIRYASVELQNDPDVIAMANRFKH